MFAKTQRTTESVARRGFMMVEITVAVVLVVVLGVMVAQCITMCLRERARMAAHHAALELAANILETARAQPFEKLDKSWAASQSVPSEMTPLLPDAKAIVMVEIDQPVVHARRVTAEVRWHFETLTSPSSVRLSTVLCAREAKKRGDEQ